MDEELAALRAEVDKLKEDADKKERTSSNLLYGAIAIALLVWWVYSQNHPGNTAVADDPAPAYAPVQFAPVATMPKLFDVNQQQQQLEQLRRDRCARDMAAYQQAYTDYQIAKAQGKFASIPLKPSC